MGVDTTLCNPPPTQELRRRRSANKEARRHRDNSNAAPITNVFCCYTTNFLFAWCCCLCRPGDAQPCGRPLSPPGRSLHPRPPLTGAMLSEAYFSFYLFSFLSPNFFFFSILSPTFSLSPNPTERQHIKIGKGSGGKEREKDLRNADTAVPRLSGLLPFDASVFFLLYVIEGFDACLMLVIRVNNPFFCLSLSCSLRHHATNSENRRQISILSNIISYIFGYQEFLSS